MENEFFGSKFYNSRLNTILLFVLIVLMIVTLYLMFKNKEVYLPSLNKEEIVETNTDLISSDSIKKDIFIKDSEINIVDSTKKNSPEEYPYFKKNEMVILDSIYGGFVVPIIKKVYQGHIAIVGTNLSLFDKTFEEPECGKDLKISSCIFLADVYAEGIQKIAEWPNSSFNPKGHSSYYYKKGSLRRCLNKEPFCLADDEKLYFTTWTDEGCNIYTEEWSFNMVTNEFILEKPDPYSGGGC